jgi:hypothetical protein
MEDDAAGESTAEGEMDIEAQKSAEERLKERLKAKFSNSVKVKDDTSDQSKPKRAKIGWP